MEITQPLSVIVHPHPDGHDFVWSNELADVFGKRHGDVLRSIDAIFEQLSEPERKRTFALRERAVPVGTPINGVQRTRLDRFYAMTRDGFTLAAMSFTGTKALQFKLAYISKFNELEAFRRASERQKTEQLVQEDSILQLVPFTARQKQLECSRLVSSRLMNGQRDANAAIDHFRQSFRVLTGKTPTNYVLACCKEGHKVRSKSGREVLRKLEPAKACTLAMMDNQVVQHGISVLEQEKVGLPQALVPAFDALLKLGYGLPQLEIRTAKTLKAAA